MIKSHYFSSGKEMTLCGLDFPLGRLSERLNDGFYHLCTLDNSGATCDECILLKFGDMSIKDEQTSI